MDPCISVYFNWKSVYFCFCFGALKIRICDRSNSRIRAACNLALFHCWYVRLFIYYTPIYKNLSLYLLGQHQSPIPIVVVSHPLNQIG